MAYNESGHAMNAAAFERMHLELTGLEDRYKPSNPEITVEALKSTKDEIKTSMEDVKRAEALFNDLIKKRQNDFEPISGLITRILGVVESSSMLGSKKTALRSLGKKITGANTKKKTTPTEESAVTVSTSRMSYIMRLDNLEMLLMELEQTAEYAPNDQELTISSLREMIGKLKAQKEEIDNATAALSKARHRRDTLLYAVEKGASDLLKKVKSYVKSWPEGVKGNDYQRINKISIKKY